MKRSATALLAILCSSLLSCSSTGGGPSGGLIGLLSGGLLGHLGDEYITDSGRNLGSTTIQNSDGTTTTIDGNGQVTSSGSSNNTNNTVNVNGTGTTTDGTTGTVTGTGTSSSTGNTIITSTGNTGISSFDKHRGLITGAAAGLAAGMLTDSFRKHEVEKKYDEGYAKAKSDAIKEFYWLKKDAQKTMKGGDDPPLQYRYYEVEVPEHTTSDGVIIEKHRRVIEVVE